MLSCNLQLVAIEDACNAHFQIENPRLANIIPSQYLWMKEINFA